jgi:hypothetical protein
VPGELVCLDTCYIGELEGVGKVCQMAFRRRYFTSRAALARSLDTFMQFYNFERPHHGYRLRGLIPATAFHGAMAAAR